MSETTLELTQPRKVKIYSTLAQNLREIETAAMTYGDLCRDMAREGIPYHGMTAAIGETSQGLISASSALLPGAQTIFLMPQEVKSGDGPSWDNEEDEDEEEEFDDFEEDDEDEEDEIPVISTDAKQQAIHNMRIAIAHMQKVMEYLMATSVSVDPEIIRMNEMAANLRKGVIAPVAHNVFEPAAHNIFE
jgi:hypothetical protein